MLSCGGKYFRFTAVFISYCRHASYAPPSAGTPVITVPTYLENSIKRLKAKQDQRKYEKIVRKSQQGDKNIPIITCRRPELNFYLHQTYPKYEELPLASKGWKHRKANGDHFIIHPYGKNPALANQNFVEETEEDDETTERGFSKFNLHERLSEGIEAIGLKYPTIVQMKAIPQIMKKTNVICSAETGSGKTLAYLIPIMDIILKNYSETRFSPRSPSALVLVPSRELAEQVAGVAKQLGGYCGISVSTLASGVKNKEYSSLNSQVDITVATIGAITKAVTRGVYNLSLVRHVIVDEADTMMDDSFSDDLAFFLQRLPFQGRIIGGDENYGAQIVLVGATFPKHIPDVLKDITDVQSFVEISTNSLHRLLPHVKQKFLRLSKSARPGKLVEIVKTEVHRKKTIMIFSNTSPTCDWISLFLNENGVPNSYLHSNVPEHIRERAFKEFQEGKVNVISCTDLGSRGLDTVQVEHVINYEFPWHMSDYIHRVGRTGRVGSKDACCVTSFVTAADTPLVQKIETAARRIQALPSVDANIKRKILEKEIRETENFIKSRLS